MFEVPSSDGVRLAVHQLGTPGPTATPLLVGHATGFHGHIWRALAAELPDRRLIAPDFRGFGDSTEPDNGVDWRGYCDDVVAVVDALPGIDPRGMASTGLDGVGHSMGGAALLLAEQARPGTFRALVCFEPIVFPPSPLHRSAPNPLAEVTRHRRERFDSVEEAIARYGSKPPLGSLRADVLEDYVRHGFSEEADGSIRLKCDREHEARTYETGAHHGGFERLGEVGCPVLVVAGGETFGPAAAAPAIAEALPHGELLVIPELGHFGPLEDPVRFASIVRDFLDRR